jgi:hypothetical protein
LLVMREVPEARQKWPNTTAGAVFAFGRFSLSHLRTTLKCETPKIRYRGSHSTVLKCGPNANAKAKCGPVRSGPYSEHTSQTQISTVINSSFKTLPCMFVLGPTPPGFLGSNHAKNVINKWKAAHALRRSTLCA